MGTRADFWLRDYKRLSWLGSVAGQGYPRKVVPLLQAASGDAQARVEQLLDQYKRLARRPEFGWPWRHEGDETDVAYVLEPGDHPATLRPILVRLRGGPWWEPDRSGAPPEGLRVKPKYGMTLGGALVLVPTAAEEGDPVLPVMRPPDEVPGPSRP